MGVEVSRHCNMAFSVTYRCLIASGDSSRGFQPHISRSKAESLFARNLLQLMECAQPFLGAPTPLLYTWKLFKLPGGYSFTNRDLRHGSCRPIQPAWRGLTTHNIM